MARPISLGRSDLTLNLGEPAEGRSRNESPMRIAIFGDFRGRENAPATEADRRPVRVDRDDFDDVMARHAIEIELPLGGGASSLRIPLRELDDLHPDRLLRNLELFRALRELRAELSNSSTFERAAARLRGGEVAARPAAVDPASLLDQMLGGGSGSPAAAAPSATSDVEAFIQKIVAPYLSPRIDRAQQADLVGNVDEAISGQMRAILHHPRFQAVEAAWRAAFFLVRRLETGSDLQFYLLDVTKQELAEVASDTGGGNPWGLLVGLHAFGPEEDDVALLTRVAAMARRVNAPFLAGTSGNWLDAPDSESWQAFRQSPDAAYLGLVSPRMLLRLPYGKEGASVESFDFEEMPVGSVHEAYLWGSPAVACAYLLAEAFSRQGWDMRPGDVREITGLPLYVYREDGEAQVKPCAEVILSDRVVEAMLDRGLMPLLSLPGQDAVRLARFSSVASPPTMLFPRPER